MSSHVTVCARREGDEHRLGWHLYRDALDRTDRIHLELRGLVAVEVSANAGREPSATLIMRADDWWALVRHAAAARARGAGEPAHAGLEMENARAERPRWTALANERQAVASRIAQELSTQVGMLRRAVERSLSTGTDPLIAACAEALLARSPLAQPPESAEAREAVARAMDVVMALRGALGDDDESAWHWLLSAKPPALSGRTPLQALRDGDDAAVIELLGQSAAGGFA